MRDASSHPNNLLSQPPIGPRLQSPPAQLTSKKRLRQAPASVPMWPSSSFAGEISQKAPLASLHPPPFPHPPSPRCTQASGPAGTPCQGHWKLGEVISGSPELAPRPSFFFLNPFKVTVKRGWELEDQCRRVAVGLTICKCYRDLRMSSGWLSHFKTHRWKGKKRKDTYPYDLRCYL